MHDPRVCIEDAITACDHIAEFIGDMNEQHYLADAKTRSAVERQFEIIGEALNRIKRIALSFCSILTMHMRLSDFATLLHTVMMLSKMK